jgi:hypothetical protein
VQRRLIVAGIVAAVVIAAFFLGRATSDGSCGDREVRVDGDCEAIRPGEPATRDAKDRAEYIASVANDQDPPAGGLSAHCAFQGIAAGRVDVHLCAVDYVDSPRTLRLENERGSRRYRVTLLSDPHPPVSPELSPAEGKPFECVYEDNLCPTDDSGG